MACAGQQLPRRRATRRRSAPAARAQRLCSVETGIGSDGVLEVTRRDGSHAAITIWNPDGSTAEMSGNGVRIAARWLAAESGAKEVTIETAGRQVTARMLNAIDTDTDVGAFTVGVPESVAGIELTTASVGNPHAVVRLDDPTRDDLLRLGPVLEVHDGSPIARTSNSYVSTAATISPCSSGNGERGRRALPALRRSPRSRSRSNGVGVTARSMCICRVAISVSASPTAGHRSRACRAHCVGDDDPLTLPASGNPARGRQR